MMITKRQYLVTILLFLVLLLLFMGFQLSQNAVNASGKHVLSELPAFEGGAERMDRGFSPAEELRAGDAGAEWMLYIGSEDSRLAETVREWSCYSSAAVACAQTLPEEGSGSLPAVVMIEPAYAADYAGRLAELMDAGTDVIFLALPDYDTIAGNDTLRELLGIRYLVRPSASLQGVRLFAGFLLGGERIFDPEQDTVPNADARQDLDLTVPWYAVRRGTKTFMQGIPAGDEEQLSPQNGWPQEDLPAIVWRSSYGAGEAYAVNGSYMENRRIGMGMLQAMMYQRSSYLLYPVVNARVFSVAGCPILTDENEEEVRRIYGWPATRAQTDIMMPMLITLAARYDVKPSCFLAVKYDESDPAQPQTGLLKKLLPMIQEMKGELAWSSARKGTAATDGSAAAESDYLRREAGDYAITASLAHPDRIGKLPEQLSSAGFRDIRTIVSAGYSEEHSILGFLPGDVTLQQATRQLTKHSYLDELELLGVQTVLGYDNAAFDMGAAFHPADASDEWQNLSRTVFSNLTTYSYPFRAEDWLTATESDARVRAFLSLDSAQTRTDDSISLTLDGPEGVTYYFILRTHDEKVISVSGGSSVQLEDNAYLIAADRNQVEIRLAPALTALGDMEGRNR